MDKSSENSPQVSQNKHKGKGKCKKLLRSVDMYGVPVSLTYKKQNMIKSNAGGVATIVSRLIVVAYLAF